MRGLALICCLLPLSGCAYWRPPAHAAYCSDLDGEFSVDYSWDPPTAHLIRGGEPTLDLPLLGVARSSEGGRRLYGSQDGLRLEAYRGGANLYQPGVPPLQCLREPAIGA